MEWGAGELLFYGGLIVTVGSLLAAILFLCIYKVKSAWLKAQLDIEYGGKKK